MSKKEYGILSEEELAKVAGGVQTGLSQAGAVTITLEEGETASEEVAKLSFPFGLKLDAASDVLLKQTIVPQMEEGGHRTVLIHYSLVLFSIHIDDFAFLD